MVCSIMKAIDVIDLTDDADDVLESPHFTAIGKKDTVVIDLTQTSEKPKKQTNPFGGVKSKSIDMSTHDQLFAQEEKREKAAEERRLKFSQSTSSMARVSSTSTVSIPQSSPVFQRVKKLKNDSTEQSNNKASPRIATSEFSFVKEELELVVGTTSRTVPEPSVSYVSSSSSSVKPVTVAPNAPSSSASSSSSSAAIGISEVGSVASGFLARTNKLLAERTPQKSPGASTFTTTPSAAVSTAAAPVVAVPTSSNSGSSSTPLPNVAAMKAAGTPLVAPSPDMAQYATPKQAPAVSSSSSSSSAKPSYLPVAPALLTTPLTSEYKKTSVSLSGNMIPPTVSVATTTTPSGGGATKTVAAMNSNSSSSSRSMCDCGGKNGIANVESKIEPSMSQDSASSSTSGRKRSGSGVMYEVKDLIEINDEDSNDNKARPETPSLKKSRSNSTESAATVLLNASSSSASPLAAATPTAASAFSGSAAKFAADVSPSGSGYWTAVESPIKTKPAAGMKNKPTTKTVKKAKKKDTSDAGITAAVSGKRTRPKVNYNESVEFEPGERDIPPSSTVNMKPLLPRALQSTSLPAPSSSSSSSTATAPAVPVHAVSTSNNQLVTVHFLISNMVMFVPDSRKTLNTRDLPLTASYCFSAADYRNEAAVTAVTTTPAKPQATTVAATGGSNGISSGSGSGGSGAKAKKQPLKKKPTVESDTDDLSSCCSDSISLSNGSSDDNSDFEDNPRKGNKNQRGGAAARKKTATGVAAVATKVTSKKAAAGDTGVATTTINAVKKGRKPKGATSTGVAKTVSEEPTVVNSEGTTSSKSGNSVRGTAADVNYVRALLVPRPSVETYWSQIADKMKNSSDSSSSSSGSSSGSIGGGGAPSPSAELRAALMAHRCKTIGLTVNNTTASSYSSSSASGGNSSTSKRTPAVLVNELHAVVIPNHLMKQELQSAAEDDSDDDEESCKGMSEDYHRLVALRTIRHIPVKSLHLLKNLMTTLWTDKKWSIYHTVLCAIQSKLAVDKLLSNDVATSIDSSVCGWNEKIPDVFSGIQSVLDFSLELNRGVSKKSGSNTMILNRERAVQLSVAVVWCRLCQMSQQFHNLGKVEFLSLARCLLKLRSSLDTVEALSLHLALSSWLRKCAAIDPQMQWLNAL